MDSKARHAYGRAVAAWREGRVDEAIEALDRLDRAFPHNRDIMYGRARCLLSVGHTDEAHSLALALVQAHNDPRAAHLLAEIHQIQATTAPAKPAPLPQSPWLRGWIPITAASIGLVVAVAVLLVGLSHQSGAPQAAPQAPWADVTRGDLIYRYAFTLAALAAVIVTILIPFLPYLVRVHARERTAYDVKAALIALRWAMSAARWGFVCILALLAAWGLYRLASYLFGLLTESVASQ